MLTAHHQRVVRVAKEIVDKYYQDRSYQDLISFSDKRYKNICKNLIHSIAVFELSFYNDDEQRTLDSAIHLVYAYRIYKQFVCA